MTMGNNQCPICHEAMAVYELDGIEIDRCPACGGTWLDTGELELIAERAGTEPGPVMRALSEPSSPRTLPRRCPRCSKPLQTVKTAGEPPLEIDRCSRRHGLWFDRGELLKLLQSAGMKESDAVAVFFQEMFRYELQNPSSYSMEGKGTSQW